MCHKDSKFSKVILYFLKLIISSDIKYKTIFAATSAGESPNKTKLQYLPLEFILKATTLPLKAYLITNEFSSL